MEELLIGEKIKWEIGKFEMRGLYIEKISDTMSKVLCTEQNGYRRKCEMDVLTELLERDERV